MSVWKLLTARWGTGADETDDVRIDAATASLQTVEHTVSKINDGDAYLVSSYSDLTINQVLDFTWLMPNTTKWSHWVWELTPESETLWQVYEGATATNALANTVTPINSNRNSSNTSGTTMKYEIQADLAAANTDTDVSGATLLESGVVVAGKFTSGTAERQHKIILKQNTLYCLRATANAAGFINFSMHWYESTDIN